MPTYYARTSGNINASNVWATTPSGTAGDQTFVAGDVLVANGFTVTVNVSTDLGSTGEVRNDTTGGATTGGGFTLSNGVTLTANVIAGGATCVTTATGASVSVVGNITGSSTAASAHGLLHNSTGTLSVTGSVTGGGGNSAAGIQIGNAGSGTGAVTITGSVTGGSNANAQGVAANSFAGPVTVTGTITGGSGASGVGSFTSALVTVVGTAVGAALPGVSNSSAGGITVVGRVRGGPLTTSGVGAANATSSNGTVLIDEAEYGDSGASPTSGPIRFADKSSNVVLVTRTNGTKKTLVDPASTGWLPAASDVRTGVSYGGGARTGTCAVPAASLVAAGTPIDNTTGTAAITAAAIQSACDAALTAFSSGRLGNVATVASTGQQLANALTP